MSHDGIDMAFIGDVVGALDEDFSDLIGFTGDLLGEIEVEFTMPKNVSCGNVIGTWGLTLSLMGAQQSLTMEMMPDGGLRLRDTGQTARSDNWLGMNM